MASSKRPPLELDDLTNNLKQSSGKGIGVFFPSQPAPQEEKKPVTQEGQEKETAPVPPAQTPEKPKSARPVQPATAEATEFDLNLPTEKSETFAFTFEEWLAINQLKTELIRLLGVDLRVTKIDIIRCALHLLVADYRTRGEHSFLVNRIKNKKPVDRIRRKNPR
jgi:hypothetical protein